jgi:hypothetical protein
MNGLAQFLARKSLTAIISLVAVVAIIVALLHFGLCAQIDAKLVQISLQIDQEIIDKKLVFDTPQDRQAYKEKRIQQEIQRSGLDVCI